MQLKYSELNEGKLFLSNRRGIETKDVFESINTKNDEWELYDFLKKKYTYKNKTSITSFQYQSI